MYIRGYWIWKFCSNSQSILSDRFGHSLWYTGHTIWNNKMAYFKAAFGYRPSLIISNCHGQATGRITTSHLWKVFEFDTNRTSDRTSLWRHQMETFSALLAICVGNSPVPGEFPAQKPLTRCFDVFFDPNKRLSKQWGWWFETPSCAL